MTLVGRPADGGRPQNRSPRQAQACPGRQPPHRAGGKTAAYQAGDHGGPDHDRCGRKTGRFKEAISHRGYDDRGRDKACGDVLSDGRGHRIRHSLAGNSQFASPTELKESRGPGSACARADRLARTRLVRIGASAGDEYLPQIPTSGTSAASSEYIPDSSRFKSGSSRASSRTGSHTPPAAGRESRTREAQQPAKKRKASKPREAATLVGTRWGRRGRPGQHPAQPPRAPDDRRGDRGSARDDAQPPPRGRVGEGRRTASAGARAGDHGTANPEGEIVASPDQVT